LWTISAIDNLHTGMNSKRVILLFLFIFSANVFVNKQYNYCINWDSAGYYLYLPGLFIHHDLAYLDYYQHVDAEYQPTGSMQQYGIIRDTVTRKPFIKYPAGVAMLELPFFLSAQLYSYCAGYPQLYGYSIPYQLAVCFASIFWAVLGLIYLRKVLRKYFNDAVVAVTLLLILFGTNLWCYSMFYLGMSHSFSFGLFCLLIFVTDRWYKTQKGKDAIIIGILMGLIVLVRPTNVVAVIIPLGWYHSSFYSIGKRLGFYLSQVRFIVAGAMAMCGIVMIQCFYWHYTTGLWLIYSYRGETFNFAHPHILDGLTSYDKGWLVYTPVAVFFIAGFIPLFKHYRQLALCILLFFVVNLYIVFSWGFWQYGGGFSARALIESYAPLSFPLAALLKWAAKQKLSTRLLLCCVFAAFILLNIFQTWQITHNILPGIWISKKTYWHVFGQLKLVL
jgi:hypothetical protein